MDKRYAQTDDKALELLRLFGPDGIKPRPVQDPVPVWMGYQGPQGARRAGLLGLPLLSADGRLWESYRGGLEEAGHDVSIARMTGGVQAFVSEDPEADWPKVAPHLKHQLDSYRMHMVEGTDAPTPKPIDPEKVRTRDRDARVLSYFWCETPEEIARRTFDYVGDAPAETVFFWASIGGMSEEMVAKHVQTVCNKLGPLLRAGDPQAP
jgi:alkanesulfonate monooxygenase SsuD/methylene tetrahydromethanopterin reductase-like flavin-dependent oxidoreductase (luciferase family)